MRDPYSATNFNQGTVWGGVMANAGNVQYARGDLNSGFYVGAGGSFNSTQFRQALQGVSGIQNITIGPDLVAQAQDFGIML